MNNITFFVDPLLGDDNNSGLDPDHPWRSVDHPLSAGATVRFKRGSVIRSALHTQDGTPGAPITYSTYGEGNNPIFMGSVAADDPEQWVEVRPSIWKYTGKFASEVCNIIFDGGHSCGILRWEPYDLSNSGEWHHTGIGKTSAPEFSALTDDGDDILYLYSHENPALAYRSIECVLWGERKLVGGQRHIIMENLSFRNSGVHGYQEYAAQDVVIRNCDFRFIGGAVWNRKLRIRFGNAVEFWDGASDVVVEGCVFDNIYDAAVTHQGGQTLNIPERVYFRNNLFVDCGLAAYECREPSREVYFEHNTCINSGGGFSMQGEVPPRQSDPYPQPVGYHIFIWMIDAGTQPGNVCIRHNIFYESFGAAVSAIIDSVDEHKFIFDDNCYWQTTGELLIQCSRLTLGKTWADAMESMTSRGIIPLSDGKHYRPTEFTRYQSECKQDKNSRVVKPRFIDETSGDYRQQDDSPCRGVGMHSVASVKS